MKLVTSAKAMDAASGVGSIAMLGPSLSIPTERPVSSACRAVSSGEGVASKGSAGRQRVSSRLAMPSCSHSGARSRVARDKVRCVISCANVSSQGKPKAVARGEIIVTRPQRATATVPVVSAACSGRPDTAESENRSRTRSMRSGRGSVLPKSAPMRARAFDATSTMIGTSTRSRSSCSRTQTPCFSSSTTTDAAVAPAQLFASSARPAPSGVLAKEGEDKIAAAVSQSPT